jgi:hypothetical protein
MPSSSKSQRRLMLACAHNRAFAKKAGVPVQVARDFVTADKRKGKKALSKLPASKHG